MRQRPDESVLGGRGFEDRAVGGRSNPTSVELEVRYDNDDVVADVVLRRAFEGAPGRAHGGIVAAAFDDVTGFVIGQLQEPAFTGELTVRYLAPVPVDETLEIRARLDGRERRKLFISAELRAGEAVVATCPRSTSPSIHPSLPEPPTRADRSLVHHHRFARSHADLTRASERQGRARRCSAVLVSQSLATVGNHPR